MIKVLTGRRCRCCVVLICERISNEQREQSAKSKKESRPHFKRAYVGSTTSEGVGRGICEVYGRCTTFMQSTRVKSMPATRLPAADHEIPLQADFWHVYCT